MVFDHAGRNLYISDGDGLIKTFNLETFTFQTTYNLGGWLWGIDIAPDDSFILAAQASFSISPAQGTFQRVNLATGAITNINYTPLFLEGGAWDAKIGSNGLALVTTNFRGSGWTPLRQIDLSTNAITIRSDAPGSGPNGQVCGNTQIYRSADGTRLLFMESDSSIGPTFTYSAITNTFGPSFWTNTFRDWAGGAVDRNGNLVAETTGYWPIQASLFTAPNFHHIHDFNGNGMDGGLAFDAVRDVLYAVNTATDQIIAYSTISFAELFRSNVGEAVGRVPPITQFDTGTLVASADGRWLALETDSGIRLFQVPPTATPELGRATIADFNGDGHPDYVLQNASTRQTAIWYLNNNVFIGGAYGPTLAAGWVLRGAADFNRDSHPDYSLFNSATYRTGIWYLSGPTFIGGAYGPTLPSGWALVATADFNGDGKPDYVLYKASTRQTAIWYMNNNVFVSGAYGPTLPPRWNLIGVADFNGDGHPDYALFNPGTGHTAIWYLSGPTFIGSAYGPSVPSGWIFAATADFNSDGKPDYLLYAPGGRRTAIWYLNNNIFLSGAYGPTLPVGWDLIAP